MARGSTTDVGPDGFDGGLNADVAYVRAQCALLRDVCAQTQWTAFRARQDAARIHADARRARGELTRARLPRDVSAGAAARRLVEAHFGAASPDELSDLKTVVSELVNNAVLHGSGAIELRLGNRRGRARIDVIDQGKGSASRVKQRDGHHGLELVSALSLAWGTSEGSTRVWAELPAVASASRGQVDPLEGTSRRLWVGRSGDRGTGHA